MDEKADTFFLDCGTAKQELNMGDQKTILASRWMSMNLWE